MKFTTAYVFGTFMAILRKGLVQMLLATAAVYAVEVLLLGVGVGASLANGNGDHVNGLLEFVLGLLIYVGLAAQWSAVLDIAVLKAGDLPVDIGAVLRRSLVNALPVFGIGILWLLGTWLGAMFLIVPGILFGLVFWVTDCAYICEQPGFFGAFTRSRNLTRGHRAGIFGIRFLFNLGLLVVGGGYLLLVVAISAATGGHIVGKVISGLMMLAGSWIVLIALPVMNAAIYVVLRADKGEHLGRAVEKVFE